MATNKERIENLETGLGQVQDSMSRIEKGFGEDLQYIKAALSKLTETSLANKEESSCEGDRASQIRATPEVLKDGGKPLFSAKLAKLEFPKYTGDDPTEWFTRVDQFFEYQGTPDAEKVSLASYHLRGEANEWWQWLRRTYAEAGKGVSWEIFSEELWSRFGPTDCEDFDESLSKIRQTGDLRDYQREFERLGNRVRGWTQKALVGTFMGGLKSEIAEGIRMFKPKTLKDAISLARMKDEQLLRHKKAIRPSLQTSNFSPSKSKPSTPVKRLTWDEMQKRRAQGLCFNCDEKFAPGHRCTKSQLLILDGGCDQDIDEDDTEAEISLNALTGWSSTGTMRVEIQFNSCQLIVLIDSGSTHNFINEKIAGLLKLPARPTTPFNVKVADGSPLRCTGKFKDIAFSLQGIPFTATFFSLPIMGLDVVLGVQWLQQLGTVACNWKNLTMDFTWAGQPRHLQGICSQPIEPLSLKSISKELRHNSTAFAICLENSTATLPEHLHPNMLHLLTQFSDVYQKPRIGAVLSQQDRPIAFMSRALGPSKQAWSTYAKEMLAILQAIRTWRPYILGRKFFIQTDQRSLKYLVEQRVVTPEQQNWVSKLLGYDYEILYKPGKENRVADALSRVSGIPSLNSLFLPHSSLWDRIKATLTTDPYMLRIGQLASDRPGQPYIWKNGLIFFKNRVVLGVVPSLFRQSAASKVVFILTLGGILV
ncbi:hypothetical protein GH714_028059 [Hevea brasiliensis]|uniref:Reverse transcriptase RNase H-like domain-containing protein n=2 Tax=Hevea brasiliensis TaxID=3981 RepID=A0A6A6NDK6_HEVBR|nr:hypothetical protein GH714_028059 [Hevea brasiliensis]